jgi:6-phosphofructokinase
MGRKMKLDECKTSPEFIRYARQQGGTVVPGSRHVKIVTDKGLCAIPNHKGDIATGTRHSIIKMLIAIGLGGSVLTFLIALF